jgi:hypothetical protein
MTVALLCAALGLAWALAGRLGAGRGGAS